MIDLLAQEKFFRALSDVIGVSIDTTCPALVYAKCERNHYIDPDVLKILSEFKLILSSTEDFSNRSAPVDGVIRNDKTLGTRVVEFDEFQHFTP